MSEIQIIEAPREAGVTKAQVRAVIAQKFPEYRIAGLIEDANDDVWRARLVREAEFPFEDKKEDAPSDESDEPKEEKKPPFKDEGDDDESEDDDSEDEPEIGGENDFAKVLKLFKQLEKLLPHLEGLLDGGAGLGDDEDDDLGLDDEPGLDDALPPPPGEEPGGKPSPFSEAPGVGPSPKKPPFGDAQRPPSPMAPKQRTPLPKGLRRNQPPVKPGQLPSFSNYEPVSSQLLERHANVSERVAREEIANEFPQYRVDDFQRQGDRYIVKLILN